MNTPIEKAEKPPAAVERRPLRSRQWRLSIVLAEGLARRGVSPNAVSVFGLGAGILGGLFLWSTSISLAPWLCWLLAAGLVQLRLLCNLIDGMVAIESGRTSRLGELYNEIPDRISDAATLIGLGCASGSDQRLGFVAAVLAVFVAYVRAADKVAGAPQDYCGPMAKPHRMFVVTVTALLCAVVPMHTQTAWLGREWGLPVIGLGVIIVGCVITAARRLLRAAWVLEARTE
jgi:phosphatidylglycerophosphate synthase